MPMFDGNSNGVSDIWEARYGLSNPSSMVDGDADGQSDWEEWLAGTSLIDPLKNFGIESVDCQDAVTFSWPTVAGMLYRIQMWEVDVWVDLVVSIRLSVGERGV